MPDSTLKYLTDMTKDEKIRFVDKLMESYPPKHLISELYYLCQGDRKLCSIVSYKLMAQHFAAPNADIEDISPVLRDYIPVRYCGGDMAHGRLFALNICAFSSDDSIIGVRINRRNQFSIDFKILKGMRHIGSLRQWVLFKLDPTTTDDMTAMIFLPLEKNFTIEFAHFPHDSDRRIIFRQTDC